MSSPLDELREDKNRQREIEMRQGSDYMLDCYRADRTLFAERLYDRASGTCEAFRHGVDPESRYQCGLSLLFSNTPGIECAKYWISGPAAIDGIVALCDSPLTEKARHSAFNVLVELLRDEYLLGKTCKRQAKGGPFAWLLDGPKPIDNLYFNIDKIGN